MTSGAPLLLGSDARPLRVAIIGSGPAGFYSAERLFEERDLALRVDMFDRLPTPFGLVRSGVAPDHPRIKSVVKYYHKLASDPRFRFFGDIEFGTEVTLDDLRQRFHQIIFACGAQADHALGIPGEKLAGVHSARQFIAWYNGAPDYSHLHFDLGGSSAVVIGNGNVAADVARILCRTLDELARTDIAPYALDALAASRLSRIAVLGRRGPAQTSFSLETIREFATLADTALRTEAEEMELDDATRAEFDVNPKARRAFEQLKNLASSNDSAGSKALHLRFLLSPVEVLADEQGRARAVRCARNQLRKAEDGSLQPHATGQFETIEARLVFRAVGFRGVSLPGLPFMAKRGIVPNEQGRITALEGGKHLCGLYVAGWIKRGPEGLIGACKPDAHETVECLLADVRCGRMLHPAHPDLDSVDALLRDRGLAHVTYGDWLTVDGLEQERGREVGRPRVKLTKTSEIYRAISRRRE